MGAPLFDEIARLYEEELRVPANNVCRLRCDAIDKRPLLPWHVGERYDIDPRRLVIVGRPHREDEPAEERPAGTRDGRRTAERLFRDKPWPFWRYTREILARVYGSAEDGWGRVVFTTIVKCASAAGAAPGDDRTTRTMKEACIRDLGVLRQELGLLKPRAIVIATGRDYDDWLRHLPWAFKQGWSDVTHRMHVVLCGGAPLPWWEAAIEGDGDPVRVLRVGHPQGKPLEDYAALLAAWIARAGR
jgi:hypothetical protein